jgi:hypothetical protein
MMMINKRQAGAGSVRPEPCEKGTRWYWRITFNQEKELNVAIGPVRGLHFRDVLAKLDAVKATAGYLIGVVREAAVAAGDIVDQSRIAILQSQHSQTTRPPLPPIERRRN